ncbi:MAG: aminoacyl-tRNA hydrolase [Gammaproteobacteria bacterium]|nr:aminoacyl-tRNA hydrolase [Gammaproteobacteria bacterium]
MVQQIRQLVGLGNIGPQYAETRHNAGFHFIDAVASRYGVELRQQSKFHGEVGRFRPPGCDHDIWLLKPETLMNRSGLAVAALSRFHKIAVGEILIIHDELDLPPGTVRLKQGGGDGGHNGLRDSSASLGSRDYHRLRLGIGHPGHSSQVTRFVLSRAPAAERELTDAAIASALELLPEILSGDHQSVMNRLHTKATST